MNKIILSHKDIVGLGVDSDAYKDFEWCIKNNIWIMVFGFTPKNYVYYLDDEKNLVLEYEI